MLEPVNGFENVQAPSDFWKPPAEAYECKIFSAEMKTSDYDEGTKWLEVLYDIASGPYKGYYKKLWEYDKPDPDRRWKGMIKIWWPKEDGTDKDNWTKRNLKGFTNALEGSNMDYTWDWDEAKLAGMAVGILYRNEQWQLDDGRTGWTARPYRAISIMDIRDNRYMIPKDKPLTGAGGGYGSAAYGSAAYGAASANSFAEVQDDGELPF